MNYGEMSEADIRLPTPHYNFHGMWITAERYRLLRWWEMQLTPEQRRGMGMMTRRDMIEAATLLYEEHGTR